MTIRKESKMNDQIPEPIPSPNPPPEPAVTPGVPPISQDWREQYRAERWARREARWQRRVKRQTGWFMGILLILLGLILLLNQLQVPFLTNWWALFILFPAFWSFAAAWDIIQESGRVTRRAGSSLAAGLLLTILALIFLFNFNLVGSLFWPVLLLAGGLALLATALLPE
jgi:hypothetical protein